MDKTSNLKSIYLLSLLIGAIIFIAIYGFAPLDVTCDAWILNSYIETDITQRYAGWLAYRNAENFLPLTYSEFICFPLGDYASLADSIPLAMIFFKFLNPILPNVFQFEGILVLINFMLQAYFASKLISIFTSNKYLILISSAIFCFSPIFLERAFRHTSLSFHWLLIAILYLYFKERKYIDTYVSLKMLALCVLSVFIHLYFTPMLIGIFLAYVLDKHFKKKTFSKNIINFILSIAFCLFSAFSLGLLNIGTGNTSGYGSMGMNLNALFNPVSLGSDWWVAGKGQIDWSIILPIRALSENNLESFNYLGFGILLSLFFVFIFCVFVFLKNRSLILTFIKTHLFLILFSLFSFFFAISNRVYAFSYKIIDIPLPDFLEGIFNAFRASGRLFWSVNYILVFIAILFIILHFSKNEKLSILLLSFVLFIQIIDLIPALLEKHNSFDNYQVLYNQETADNFISNIDTDNVIFLEIIENRSLNASLLKESISSNLLLINRDNYKIEEMQEVINLVRADLMNNISTYENCTYITADIEFINNLKQNNYSNISITQLENYYFINFRG